MNKTLHITHKCFDYDWQFLHNVKGLSFFLFCPHNKCVGGGQEFWKDKSGIADPNSLEKENGRIFTVMAFVFLRNVRWGPASQKATKHLLANGKQWVNSLFCLLMNRTFDSPVKLLLSWSTSTHLHSTSHPMGEWTESVWMLGCWPSSAQTNHTFYTINKRRLIPMLV